MATVFDRTKRSLLKALWERGENATNHNFFLFPTIFFYPIDVSDIRIFSGNALNLGKTKLALSGKGFNQYSARRKRVEWKRQIFIIEACSEKGDLTLSQTSPGFYVSAVQVL